MYNTINYNILDLLLEILDQPIIFLIEKQTTNINNNMDGAVLTGGNGVLYCCKFQVFK